MKKNLLFLSVFVILFFTSSFSQWKWVHQYPQGNTLHWVKVWDANNWYAVGEGGLFMKTSDAGNTWTINQTAAGINEFFFTNSLYYAWFFNKDTGFVVGDKSTISLTTDGGTTFHVIPNVPSSESTTYYSAYFYDRMHGWVCGGALNDSRFVQTTDGGLTWTTNSGITDPSIFSFNDVWSPDGNIIVACAPGGLVRRSTDSGTTWTSIFTPAPGSLYKMCFWNSTNGIAAGGLNFGKAASVVLTTDAGATWSDIGSQFINDSIAFRNVKYDNGIVYVTGASLPDHIIYKSKDLGVTWDTLRYIPSTQPKLAASFMDYYFSDVNDGVILVGGQYGLLNSRIGDKITAYTTYVKAGYNYDIWGNGTGKIIAVGARSILASHPDQIMYSSNSGNTWSFPSNIIANATLQSVKMVNDNIGYTCGSGGVVYKTTDGGFSWSLLNTSIIGGAKLNKIDFISRDTGWVFSATPSFGGGQMWKTTDGGSTWNLQSYSTDITNDNTITNASMVNGIYGWLISGANIPWKTTDGGNTWTSQTLPGNFSSSTSNRIQMLDTLNGFICGGRGHIYKTTNGGAQWDTIINPCTNSGSNFLAMYWKNAKVGMVGGMSITLMTKDGGNTWSIVSNGSTNCEGMYMCGTDTTTAFMTGSIGSILTWPNFDISHVNSVSTITIGTPNQFALQQNYPNPFNPSTTIKFTIPKNGLVKLYVYNMLGQKVAELINQTMEAGNHQVNFNASGLASGVYLYRLETGNYMSEKKLIVLK